MDIEKRLRLSVLKEVTMDPPKPSLYTVAADEIARLSAENLRLRRELRGARHVCGLIFSRYIGDESGEVWASLIAIEDKSRAAARKGESDAE